MEATLVRRIHVATSNRHKIEELNAVLTGCGYRAEPAPAPKVEIQGDDVAAIAVYAAASAYSVLGRPVLVEDAGLYVDALSGFPGPYSSYVFKTIGVAGLLRLLEGIDERRAVFRSALAYAGPWGVELFTGEVEGAIADRPRGGLGFGFDPVFVPRGDTRTFAEMSLEEKSRYSHRARAARKLCEWLRRHEPL